jgi:hypothetical protein
MKAVCIPFSIESYEKPQVGDIFEASKEYFQIVRISHQEKYDGWVWTTNGECKRVPVESVDRVLA